MASNEWLNQIRTQLADTMLLVEDEPEDSMPTKTIKKTVPHLTKSIFDTES